MPPLLSLQERAKECVMPQIPRLPKKFPYRHLVSLFTVGVLIGAVSILDAFFMDDFPWIDVLWVIPIITAGFLLSPLEVIGTGMITVVLCLAAQVESEASLSIWTSSAVGVFSVIVALKARIIKGYYHRVNIVRDALENSPLAYAEFSFPGYKLVNSNQTFDTMIYGSGKRGSLLRELLPEESAGRLSEKMDQSVNLRQRVDCDEFQLTSAEGHSNFW